MNTYIYAPKDDLKHRMHWRDLYTVDEAGTLLHQWCSVIFCYWIHS